MTPTWKIRPRATHCAETGRPFVDDDPVQTCIFEGAEDGTFERRDYSVEAWAQAKNSVHPFSTWRSTFKSPPPKEESEDRKLQRGGAEGLLRRLIEEDDPETIKARFVLAVMLERRKILRPAGSERPEEHRVLFYEHGETGEIFLIIDPGIRLDEVEAVQASVVELLDREQNPGNESDSNEAGS